MEDVKKKLTENSMENDKNIYLCMLAQGGAQDTKFNIQFNSNSDGYKKLTIDSTSTLTGSSK